ncbi:glycoside hydrolase family 95 protein [Mucilaginibacter lacusdianchii]|uniref:glycoside hydrolase family 95 protein n=1 Tax=Mucilaginibacter lacusdianchii TaxID=2684211 RepID=UPI00131C7579|nr:glycoside hydrolase N-terminal domain-containing protein [Mucilaginibacter sp. JXJ CY 39]
MLAKFSYFVSHKKGLFISGVLSLLAALSAGNVSAQTQNLKLWYNQPSKKWTDALPIGNGRIGAMIFGGIDTERIQFNEQTLWTGRPRDYQREGAAQYLQPIRQLLAEGKQKAADSLAEALFMGKKDNEDTYEAQKAAWFKKIRNLNLSQTPAFETGKWTSINLPTEKGWETTRGFEGLDGAVWFHKTFTVPASWAGKNLVLSLGRIRDMDFTYVNGKQIGTTDGTNYRKYTIPASALHNGENELAIQVINYWDKGGLTSAAKELMVYPEGESLDSGIKLSGAWQYWIQDFNPPAFPRYNADYQPFADVYLLFPNQGNITNYRRDLDINNATAHVTYTSNGVNFSREYFASKPDQVIAMRLTANQPSKLTFNAVLSTLHKNMLLRKVNDHTLALSLKVGNGVLRGVSYLTVQTKGGKVDVSAKGINITGANEATLYLTAATSYKNYKDVSGDPDAICKQAVASLGNKNYQAIKNVHLADYQRLFNTFSINLNQGKNAALPTDQRILKFNSADDPSLISLFMQYGRYLLISSSRPGSGPANLQGIWNDLLTPPWGSKFTTNINLEMNYWPAEALNLSACAEPLYNMIDDLSQTGKLTAKAHYNAPGWVLHHNTDVWRGTAPVNAADHGIWVTGAAWLCHQLWEHYEYSQDKTFLKNRAYPLMKSAAEFFNANLVKDSQTGYLISTPSNSPEHGGLVAGPTMDHQIIRDLFKNCVAAAKILGVDEQFSQTLQTKYNQIAPNKIGKYGQLQEWLQDKDDTTDTHRHVSHMWGVYPGTDITWQTPDLMKAAEKSMYYRGDDGTGWSIAWKVNIWARMREGDHAYLMLSKLLSPADAVPNHEKGGVYHNLFDAHPPFQIDGNFGGAAGIAEMLLQSQSGNLELLPALPSALPNGEVKGIRARGGFVLNLNWKSGQLERVEITSQSGNACSVIYKGKSIKFSTQKGRSYKLNADLKLVKA